ncbi:MAG TPA: hypothetical protein VMT54_22420 [Candidatus Cybelea sp.]|nr:hypothetical protein [Candidatus Cybelea sp.]
MSKPNPKSKPAARETLAKASQKGSAELSESQLAKVAGGRKAGGTQQEG